MARLQRLLNLLAWGLAMIIAWTEWRDPARPTTTDEEGSPEGGADQGASSTEPASTTDEATSAASGSTPATASPPLPPPPPPPPPPPMTETPTEGAGNEDAAGSAADAAPTAAEPLFAAAAPGAPIVGTAVPIPAVRSGERPVPAGAVPGDETATCPPDYPIKGNASSMIYHRPGQPSYERTVAEFCFASEADAEGAGYRPPRR